MLNELRRFDALRDGDTGKDELLTGSMDALPPVYADNSVFDSLSPEVADHLHRNGIACLYQHQAEAMLKALSGANVVLQAPTASGKTLSFQVPMVETLVREPDAHALMIYPTKALAYDQRNQFRRIFGNMGDFWGQSIESWWYDGDVDRGTRQAIRSAPPHILLTNPEMVHNSFLAHAEAWDTFLSNLKYVVVDEMHEYRGYFGSNVSLVLRRLVHHLNQRGVSPQFFLASATCANAKEHAENLTGLVFEEVNASDQFRPERHFYFVKPDIPPHQYWKILQLRMVKAGLASMKNDKSVLVFCPTRRFAEECFRLARREAAKLREQDQCTVEPDAIRVYRGGLSSEERQQTQEDLLNGLVKLVFTTNALELGIDIGNLDGVILAGFPDSIMSAWQQIGRAGRSWNSNAFVIYYARNNPLDQFYASNLRTFIEKPFDELVVNPDNEELVRRHVPCLLYETQSLEGGESLLGTGLYEAAHDLLRRGAQPARTRGYNPHYGVDIRGTGGGMYDLKFGSKDLGTMSAQQQFREAYQRAIYMHSGTNYRVESIETTSNGGTIHLGEAPDHLRTNPFLLTGITVQNLFDGRRWGAMVEVMYGNLTVTDSMLSIREFDERTDQTIVTWVPETHNAQFSKAHAFWLTVESTDIQDGTMELQHLLRLGTLFTIPVEPHDVVPHADARDRTAYLIESYAGGIGIARKVFERWREILETGIRIAEDCRCRRGCPNCIVPPRSKDDLDKRRGITLSKQILTATEQGHDAQLLNNLWESAASGLD